MNAHVFLNEMDFSADLIYNSINEDGHFSEFDLEYFKDRVHRNYENQVEEIHNQLFLGIFYENKFKEWIDIEISHYLEKYQDFKPIDPVYFTYKEEKINDEHATQKTFIELIKEFVYQFYLSYYHTIKEEFQTAKRENIDLISRLFKPKKDSKKIIWTGTPGEFGAIFDLLFDNGFIETIGNKKSMVRQLNTVFEVRNENGAIVDDEYLYKCFNDKKKKYPPAHLKLSFSDNYHKNK